MPINDNFPTTDIDLERDYYAKLRENSIKNFEYAGSVDFKTNVNPDLNIDYSYLGETLGSFTSDLKQENPSTKQKMTEYLTSDDASKVKIADDYFNSKTTDMAIDGIGGATFTPYKETGKFFNTNRMSTFDDYDASIGGMEENEDYNDRLERANNGNLMYGLKNLYSGGRRLTTKALFSTLEGAGYIASAVGAGVTNIFNNDFQAMKFISENEFSQFFNEGYESFKNHKGFRSFKPKGHDDKGFFDQLFSSYGWNNEIADGAGFLVGAMIPGGIFAKMGKGAGMGAKFLSKVAALEEAGTALNFGQKLGRGVINSARGAAALTSGTHTGAGLSTFVWNTVSESLVESSQLYRDSYKDLIEKGATEEEAVEEAGKRAAFSFKGNLGVLALSTAFENRLLFKSMGKKIPRKNGPDVLFTEAMDAYRNVSKNKFVRKFLSADSRLGNILQAYGVNLLGEGLYEENAQLAIERMAKNRSDSILENIGNVVSKMGDQAVGATRAFGRNSNKEDREALTSIFLGGALGGSSRIVMNKLSTFYNKDAASRFEGARKYKIRTEQEIVDKLNAEKANIFAISEAMENGTIKKEEDLKPFLEKLKNLSDQSVTYEKIKNPLLRKQMFLTMAKDYFLEVQKAGLTKNFFNRVDQKNASPELEKSLSLFELSDRKNPYAANGIDLMRKMQEIREKNDPIEFAYHKLPEGMSYRAAHSLNESRKLRLNSLETNSFIFSQLEQDSLDTRTGVLSELNDFSESRRKTRIDQVQQSELSDNEKLDEMGKINKEFDNASEFREQIIKFNESLTQYDLAQEILKNAEDGKIILTEHEKEYYKSIETPSQDDFTQLKGKSLDSILYTDIVGSNIVESDIDLTDRLFKDISLSNSFYSQYNINKNLHKILSNRYRNMSLEEFNKSEEEILELTATFSKNALEKLKADIDKTSTNASLDIKTKEELLKELKERKKELEEKSEIETIDEEELDKLREEIEDLEKKIEEYSEEKSLIPILDLEKATALYRQLDIFANMTDEEFEKDITKRFNDSVEEMYTVAIRLKGTESLEDIISKKQEMIEYINDEISSPEDNLLKQIIELSSNIKTSEDIVDSILSFLIKQDEKLNEELKEQFETNETKESSTLTKSEIEAKIVELEYSIQQFQDDINERVKYFISNGASLTKAKSLAKKEFEESEQGKNKLALDKLKKELADLKKELKERTTAEKKSKASKKEKSSKSNDESPVSEEDLTEEFLSSEETTGQDLPKEIEEEASHVNYLDIQEVSSRIDENNGVYMVMGNPNMIANPGEWSENRRIELEKILDGEELRFNKFDENNGNPYLTFSKGNIDFKFYLNDFKGYLTTLRNERFGIKNTSKDINREKALEEISKSMGEDGLFLEKLIKFVIENKDKISFKVMSKTNGKLDRQGLTDNFSQTPTSSGETIVLKPLPENADIQDYIVGRDGRSFIGIGVEGTVVTRYIEFQRPSLKEVLDNNEEIRERIEELLNKALFIEKKGLTQKEAQELAPFLDRSKFRLRAQQENGKKIYALYSVSQLNDIFESVKTEGDPSKADRMNKLINQGELVKDKYIELRKLVLKEVLESKININKRLIDSNKDGISFMTIDGKRMNYIDFVKSLVNTSVTFTESGKVKSLNRRLYGTLQVTENDSTVDLTYKMIRGVNEKVLEPVKASEKVQDVITAIPNPEIEALSPVVVINQSESNTLLSDVESTAKADKQTQVFNNLITVANDIYIKTKASIGENEVLLEKLEMLKSTIDDIAPSIKNQAAIKNISQQMLRLPNNPDLDVKTTIEQIKKQCK